MAFIFLQLINDRKGIFCQDKWNKLVLKRIKLFEVQTMNDRACEKVKLKKVKEYKIM